jgi:hypothetical protein
MMRSFPIAAAGQSRILTGSGEPTQCRASNDHTGPSSSSCVAYARSCDLVCEATPGLVDSRRKLPA